jgi:O-antigen ligase
MAKEKAQSSLTTEKLKSKTLAYVEIFVFLTLILLPLKFGTLVGVPETTLLYPSSPMEFIIVSWPVPFFPIISGTLLVVTCIVLPFPPNFQSSFRISAIWALLAICSLIGFIHATVFDYAAYEIVHLFAIAAFGLTIFRLVDNNPSLKIWYISGIVVGVFISAYFGIYQLLWGFEETKEFAYEQLKRAGISKFSGEFAIRLNERRVSANFSLCNSYAGYLLLTIPLSLWGMWKLGEKVKPGNVCRVIFAALTAALLFTLLYFTKSRAAFVALGGALMFFIMFLPFKPKFKALCLLGAIVFIVAGGSVIYFMGRNLDSMYVRGDYYRVAVRAFLENPVFGIGWGEFFHAYMKWKTYLTTEAPHTPHNFVLAFASQVGISGLLMSCLALAYPVWACLKKVRSETFKYFPASADAAILLGWTAWALHSLSDINLQIPGAVSTALTLVILTGLHDRKETDSKSKKLYYGLWYAFAVISALAALYGGIWLVRGESEFYKLQLLCDPRSMTPKQFSEITVDDVHKQLAECVKRFPKSPFPWGTAADFMMMKNRPFLAEQYYKEASKRTPKRPSFYYRLYRLQVQMGKLDEAEKNFQKAKELFPNNPNHVRISPQAIPMRYGPLKKKGVGPLR